MTRFMLLASQDSQLRHVLEDAAEQIDLACRTITRGEMLSADLSKPGHAGQLALLVVDIDIAQGDPLDFLRAVRGQTAAPILAVCHAGNEHLAESALIAGASDTLAKPVTLERAEMALRNALKVVVLEEEVARLKQQAEGKLAWSEIIAISPEMQRAIGLAKRAANLDIPVLIEGESGTGRTALARAIHAASLRAGKPLHIVGKPEYDSERPPSITDAIWEQAKGGTLFVEEVGELGAHDQSRLAQLLSHSPGAGHNDKTASVRLILSSSLDLIERVKNGLFREDLFYLINVFPVWIPPLRDRPDDLAHLVWHYLARFAAQEGKRIQSLDPRALMLLKAYSWPGNVRQLEIAVHRAVILAEGDHLRVEHMPQIAAHVSGFAADPHPAPKPRVKETYRGPAMIGSPFAVTARPSDMLPRPPLGIPALTEDGEIRSLTEIEADLIRLALGHYRGHITEVARRLGIGRSTLYRKMREFGLDLRHNSV